MLIELPNRDWIDPKAVQGVRLITDSIEKYGPRVTIDACGQQGLHLIAFDDIEAAREWIKKFGADCMRFWC